MMRLELKYPWKYAFDPLRLLTLYSLFLPLPKTHPEGFIEIGVPSHFYFDKENLSIKHFRFLERSEGAVYGDLGGRRTPGFQRFIQKVCFRSFKEKSKFREHPWNNSLLAGRQLIHWTSEKNSKQELHTIS